MKLLFVSNTFPFPPKNGIEFVNANLIKQFTKFFSIDFLLVSNDPKQIERMKNEQEHIGINTIHVPEKGAGRLKKILDELTLVAPTYFSRGTDDESVDKMRGRDYDWVWCGDVSSLGLILSLRKHGCLCSSKIAAGINEAASVVYRAAFIGVLKGKRRFTLSSFMRGLRYPIISLHEREYLGDIQLVHVQTNLEKSRVEKIIGHGKSIVVAAPMGKNDSLSKVLYNGGDGSVLCSLELAGERAKEGEWFLVKVWPKILRQRPDAKLYIVGARANKVRNIIPLEGVELCGYVEDLSEVYQRASLVVIPTFRGTGIITRVLDAITAGCPLISTPEALGTITGLEIGKQALSASTDREFVSSILQLLEDSEMRRKLSKQAKSFSENLLTWEESASHIINILETY